MRLLLVVRSKDESSLTKLKKEKPNQLQSAQSQAKEAV
jgi:hypothetical protein